MAEPCRLIDAESGKVVVPQLRLATTFWRRLRGLQFRTQLSDGQGLLIAPCRSIHTFCMRFAIDVAMIDREGRVLCVIGSVAPWRVVAGPPGTFAILEMAAGTLSPRVANGHRVVVTSDETVPDAIDTFAKT